MAEPNRLDTGTPVVDDSNMRDPKDAVYVLSNVAFVYNAGLKTLGQTCCETSPRRPAGHHRPEWMTLLYLLVKATPCSIRRGQLIVCGQGDATPSPWSFRRSRSFAG